MTADESREALRRRIIARLRKIRRDLTEQIRTKQWWNSNRLEEMPFDIGWDLVQLSLVDRQLEAWHAGDVSEAMRLADELVANCEAEAVAS